MNLSVSDTVILVHRHEEDEVCQLLLVGLRISGTTLMSVTYVCVCVCLQPVGFVTFNTRAGAEAAKQDLQVRATQT